MESLVLVLKEVGREQVEWREMTEVSWPARMTKSDCNQVDVRGDKKIFSIGLDGDTVKTKEERYRVAKEALTWARVVVIAEAANGRSGNYSRRTGEPAFSFSIPKSSRLGRRRPAIGSFAI